MNSCIVCGGNNKSIRFWLCKNCAIEWGCYKTPYKQWPDWIRALKNIEQRTKRQRERMAELPIDPVILAHIVETHQNK